MVAKSTDSTHLEQEFSDMKTIWPMPTPSCQTVLTNNSLISNSMETAVFFLRFNQDGKPRLSTTSLRPLWEASTCAATTLSEWSPSADCA